MNWHFYATAVVFVCCLILGGGTRPGFLSDALLQALCIPLLLLSLVRLAQAPRLSRWIGAGVSVGLLGLIALQLVPLPQSLWASLPGHGPERETFEVLAHAPGTAALTVSLEATILAALSLLPPVAVFLAVLALSAPERKRMVLIFLGVSGASVFLGLAQVSQGPSSLLRFFENTNAADAVGFFANRNHYAALLYCAIPFAVAWTSDLVVARPSSKNWRNTRNVALAAGLTLLIGLLAASVVARSRAGIVLSLLGVMGGLIIGMRAGRGQGRASPTTLLLGAVVIAVVMVMQVAIFRVLDRFTDDPLQDARGTFTRTTLAAAAAYAPLGSGLGTFRRVFPTWERPQTALMDTYVNRAHNDFAEFALEAGVVALVAMALFGFALFARAVPAWRRRGPDAAFMQAASLAVGLLLLHCAVDYPLRTSALAVTFAFCVGLLCVPLPEMAEAKASSRDEDARSPGERRAAREPQDAPSPMRSHMPQARKAWRPTTALPAEWQSGRAKNDQPPKK